MKILFYIFYVSFIPFVLNAENIIEIDLTQAQFGEINSEQIFEDFEIIPLETHKDGLLNIKTVSYYLTEKYIIAGSFLQEFYLFDRKTGAFIREVSSFGQGPDQYAGWICSKYALDEKNNILFANDGAYTCKLWKCINIETNKVESIMEKPLSENDDESFFAHTPWRMKDNIYISFVNNMTGKDKVRLVVFDKKGNIIDKYPNYLEYDKMGNMSSSPYNNGIFYYYNGLTYFKEWCYNDTVFCVTEKKMLPHIIFKSGNKQASYYHQIDADYNKGKYLINFVYESDSFVLFNFLYYNETRTMMNSKYGENVSTHTGYYDKKRKRVYISSTSDFKKSGYTINGIPETFYPIYINGNKEMIGMIEPEKLLKHKVITNSKYKNLFLNIQEDDNPVIIIAKLKKAD